MNTVQIQGGIPESEQIFLICYTKLVAGTSQPGKSEGQTLNLDHSPGGILDREMTHSSTKCSDREVEISAMVTAREDQGPGEKGFPEQVLLH